MPANQFGIDMSEIATIQANKQRTNILAQEMDMKQREFDAKQETEARLAPIRARIAAGDKSAVNEYAAIDPKGGSELMSMYQSSDKAKREEIAAGVEEYGRLAAGLAQKLSTSKNDNDRTTILQQFKGFLAQSSPELAAKIPDRYTPEVAMMLQQGIMQARTVKDLADEEFNTKKNTADNVFKNRELALKEQDLALKRQREGRIAAGGSGGGKGGRGSISDTEYNSMVKLLEGAKINTDQQEVDVIETERVNKGKAFWDKKETVYRPVSKKITEDQRDEIIQEAVRMSRDSGGRDTPSLFLRMAKNKVLGGNGGNGNKQIGTSKPKVAVKPFM